MITRTLGLSTQLTELRAGSLVVLLLMPNFTGVMLFAALFGLSYMGTAIGTSMYTLGLFGKEHKGFAFGFIWLVHQIGAFFSTQLGANAHDWFGDYQRTMIATGVIALVSFFISLNLSATRSALATGLPCTVVLCSRILSGRNGHILHLRIGYSVE